MSYTIEARGLQKKFGDFTAVHDVSFGLESGEIFGLLGPNGAGKTTTLRMLSGLLKPTSGEAFVSETSVQQEPTKALAHLGFLTGDMDLYRRLKPEELLTFFGELYQTPKAELKARVSYLMKAFDINDFADRHCEKLSTGQKQRVGIARTLVHDPQVVVLDEPTTGLDIMASEFVLQFIQKVAKQDGKTVLFSTHNLTEVERLCDRIGIVDRGRLVYLGTVADLLAQTGHQSLAESFFHLVGGSTKVEI
ncbi:hypothetical protein CEQ90_08440 [Lewinellaceae bacterium SD302]|nr:hypothetical protein CEQ90_08440 [Lewinellaceae bacterium SD302]